MSFSEAPPSRPRPSRVPIDTMRSARSNGSPRRITALTSVKTALLAPMPSASATSAANVNDRILDQEAAAKRMSCQMECM